MNEHIFDFPKTEKRPVTDQLHTIKLTDNYRWLEDKTSSEVIEWTRKQHEATKAFLNDTIPEIDGLRAEIEKVADRDIRYNYKLKAGRTFFTQQLKGEQQPKIYTKIDGEDRLLFDPEARDASGKSSIQYSTLSKSATKIAVGVQAKGDEILTYYIIDTLTGEEVCPCIEGVRGFSWTNDEMGGYIRVNTREMIDQQKPLKIYLHRLGTDRADDEFLFSPEDAKKFANIWDAEESDLTFLLTGDYFSGSIRMRKAGTNNDFVEIYNSSEFSSNPFGLEDRLYFHSNHDASNNKIFTTSVDKPYFEHWETYFEPADDQVLEHFYIARDYLIVCLKKDVLSKLYLYDLDGKTLIKSLQLPIDGDVTFSKLIREENKLMVYISSFTSTSNVYLFDLTTLEWEFFYHNDLGIALPEMVSKQLFYASKDGTNIPLFVVHRADIELDGTNPALLSGYGGFNQSTKPQFIGGADLAFIKRGGVIVKTCLRGGSEYGEKWHQAGMLSNKQNTFDDFITAAEFLIREKYTSAEKLAIYGGSNGGLLVGAAVTQRPDLFKACISSVPLLDMIRYHQFLIARYWIPEYGDSSIKDEFEYLLQYSPYHNIRQGIDYPTMLFIAGENDTRVDPLHAKKMVAAMQNNEGQQNPIMLYMDYDSGHGSGKSTAQFVEGSLIRMRFIMGQLGMS